MRRITLTVAAIIAAFTIGTSGTTYAASNGYTITPGDSLGVHCSTHLNITRSGNNAAYLTCDSGQQPDGHVNEGATSQGTNNAQPASNHSTDNHAECRKDRKGNCK